MFVCASSTIPNLISCTNNFSHSHLLQCWIGLCLLLRCSHPINQELITVLIFLPSVTKEPVLQDFSCCSVFPTPKEFTSQECFLLVLLPLLSIATPFFSKYWCHSQRNTYFIAHEFEFKLSNCHIVTALFESHLPRNQVQHSILCDPFSGLSVFLRHGLPRTRNSYVSECFFPLSWRNRSFEKFSCC